MLLREECISSHQNIGVYGNEVGCVRSETAGHGPHDEGLNPRETMGRRLISALETSDAGMSQPQSRESGVLWKLYHSSQHAESFPI